jgi:hypothetical protein
MSNLAETLLTKQKEADAFAKEHRLANNTPSDSVSAGGDHDTDTVGQGVLI